MIYNVKFFFQRKHMFEILGTLNRTITENKMQINGEITEVLNKNTNKTVSVRFSRQ